ncbi:unnamed protein product [Alopecurus aequalis]
MKSPRFVNLITHDWDRRMYSLHRLDTMKHLFYPSSARARESAAAAAQDLPNTTKKKSKNKPSIIQRLPEPEINFHPTPGRVNSPSRDSFSLLGRHGVVFTDSSARTSLYDTARGVFTVISPMNSRKSYQRPWGISLPVVKAWPPFLSDSDPPSFRRPTIQNCCYATVDDGSTICISSMEQGIGTYAFDTASHVWRQVGQWALPFHGRAEYVPELNLWLSLAMNYCSPSPGPRLCAFDLSAMDGAEHPPTPQHAWEYLDYTYPEEDNKKMLIHELYLVNLGSGMFCIATHIRIMWSPPPDDGDLTTEDSSSCNTDQEIPMMDIPTEEFVVLTGVKVERCCSCDGPQMIKHKSRRYDFRQTMKAVL